MQPSGVGVAWLIAEHARPHGDELGLVERAVLVRVEHVDEVPRHLGVEAHQLLQDARHLVRTQDAVVILVQLVETRRYLIVAASANRQATSP